MPTRYLKPGIRDSDRIESVSDPNAEILFYRLLVTVDDFGRMDARPLVIKSACFPIRTKATAEKCLQWMCELQESRLILLYDVDGKPYLQIEKWDNKPRATESRFPAPPADAYKRIQVSADVNDLHTVLPATETVTETDIRQPQTTAGKGKNGKSFQLPSEIDAALWQEFVEMRNKIRKPLTDRAKWLIVGRLTNLEQEGHNPRKVLQQSIRNSWQDVFPIREDTRR